MDFEADQEQSLGDLPEANREIFGLEQEIIELQSKLDQLRQRTVRGTPVTDYELTAWTGRRPDCRPCSAKRASSFSSIIWVWRSYCTLWADGFTGLLPYLERIAAFVVVSPDDIETQKAGAARRGWKFRMLSAKGTSLFRDMGFESQDKSSWPGVSTLYKDESGQVRRHSLASFGPGDKFCPVFSFADLLPFSRDLGL